MDDLWLGDFRHDSPHSRTLLTNDSGSAIREEMATAALSRAMIVCSPREARSALTARIVEALGDLHSGTFDGAQSHPTLAAAERGADLARRLKADCLIAVGGGGASDQAKGIALWLAEAGNLHPISASNTGRRPPFTGTNLSGALPIIAVPTTASGAELTPGFGQKDSAGHKLLFRDSRLFARLVVLDPQAVAATPVDILVPTCMNAIAHCVEALYSLGRDPVSSTFAIAGFEMLMEGLRQLSKNPTEAAYRNILIGSNLAGRAIINARTGLHHGICHVLGGAGVPHGIANAIMLPHVIRFNAKAAGNTLLPLCKELGVAGADGLANAISEVRAQLGVIGCLRDAGITREQVPSLASRVVLEPGMRFNPRQNVTVPDIESLLLNAW